MTLGINIDNINGFLLNINDIFDDNGYQLNQELCIKPLNINIVKVM